MTTDTAIRMRGIVKSFDEQHVLLVRSYFEKAGGFADVMAEDRSPGGDGDPLYAVWGRAA